MTKLKIFLLLTLSFVCTPTFSMGRMGQIMKDDLARNCWSPTFARNILNMNITTDLSGKEIASKEEHLELLWKKFKPKLFKTFNHDYKVQHIEFDDKEHNILRTISFSKNSPKYCTSILWQTFYCHGAKSIQWDIDDESILDEKCDDRDIVLSKLKSKTNLKIERNIIYLFDNKTQELIRTLRFENREFPKIAAISADKKIIAVSCDKKTLELYDVETGDLLQNLKFDNKISCMALDKNGSLLSVATGNKIFLFKHQNRNVF